MLNTRNEKLGESWKTSMCSALTWSGVSEESRSEKATATEFQNSSKRLSNRTLKSRSMASLAAGFDGTGLLTKRDFSQMTNFSIATAKILSFHNIRFKKRPATSSILPPLFTCRGTGLRASPETHSCPLPDLLWQTTHGTCGVQTAGLRAVALRKRGLPLL